MKVYKIAQIPGDGIGRDVTAAAWAVLTKAASAGGYRFEGRDFPWSCKFYKATDAQMPDD